MELVDLEMFELLLSGPMVALFGKFRSPAESERETLMNPVECVLGVVWRKEMRSRASAVQIQSLLGCSLVWDYIGTWFLKSIFLFIGLTRSFLFGIPTPSENQGCSLQLKIKVS